MPSAWIRSGRFKSAFFPLFDVYAFDQKLQEEKDFCQTRKQANTQVAAGEKKSRKNVYEIAKTGNDQQDPQDSGKETRLENQIPQGKQPKAREYKSNTNSIRVQTNKQVRQSLQLRCCKNWQVISATQEL
jgi:hypothetical protein